MCTDYEIWYACGHKGHPARPNISQSNEQEIAVYADCGPLFPTARVVNRCSRFKESGRICQVQDRLVVSQRWDIVCCDNKNCKPIEKFSDTGCQLLQKNLESSAIAGLRYLDKLTEKERTELYKTSARISQPPVWGRKGPHVKKPRKVKTKEERERDKEERERAKVQKEVEKAEKKELAAARALADLASGKPKGGRKKNTKGVHLQKPVVKKVEKKQKPEAIGVDSKSESTKKKKKPATVTVTKVEPKSKGKRKAAADQPSKPASKRQRKNKTA
ncbi:hypothetical protein AOL_s00097g482 [Orbilia oligospora ATCC 24927]|uniref:Uncharacterized protein n=1 Tax=Arthrobotrys oligospora (strain ATCC 24927 / CBS 115.81 / DSM 1491) TaxID=756982 RepID=G1XJF5_ARTOA|nr:hypothetical protein AOL_s00097g482 [Orbilia oligospora ATCC 24927]EGX46734.1 hypothetical protein AOL_s00097g482 [Orbilia oligospora ATCC 24927]